jgi:hypothetical protein
MEEVFGYAFKNSQECRKAGISEEIIQPVPGKNQYVASRVKKKS